MKAVASSKSNCFKESEETDNNLHQLFKPLVLNQRLIRRTESDITTITNSTLPLSTINNESNIPLIYPQFQLGSLSGLKSSPQMPPFIYQESQNKKLIEIKNKPCCSCNKTKCIKKYCECFANNKFCKNCLCPDCRNKDIFIGAYNTNMSENKSKEIVVCTCSKSGCNKKYCDCFKENKKCNIKCRCINCLNMEESPEKSNNENEKVISLDETRCDSGKKSLSGEINEFFVQKISVCIRKSQTYINIEKLSTDDFSLLCKKRKGEKI